MSVDSMRCHADALLPVQAESALRALDGRAGTRLEALGVLAGGVAHDFNNILAAIIGFGEMALRFAPPGSRLRADIEGVLAAGRRGHALVDRILRFGNGQPELRRAVRMESLVREVIALTTARLPADIRVEACLHAPQVAVLADASQLHQVVMNLAANAVQAMPEGGVLQVALDAVRVAAPRRTRLGALAPGDYARIDVVDTGVGMTAQTMQRIFEPFFTTKEPGAGTGLGLAVVHTLVRALGGGIDVASEIGMGTTFTVYLPCAVSDGGDC